MVRVKPRRCGLIQEYTNVNGNAGCKGRVENVGLGYQEELIHV